MQSHQSWPEGKCHFINLMSTILLLWSSMRLGYSITQAQCWLMFKLLFSRTCSSFLAKLLSRLSAPSWSCYMRLVQPSWRNWHFPLLNLNRFLSNHFPSLLRSLESCALPFSILTASPGGIICKLAEGASCPTLQVVNVKQLNTSNWLSAGLMTTLWGWRSSQFSTRLPPFTHAP